MSYDEPFGVTVQEMYFIITALAMFSIFGSAGNAVVLYVFSTTNDHLVSTLFIIVLAVVDFVTCLVIIPFTMVVELVSYNVRFDVLCKFYQFLITSNIPFSALIMTAIAVDRYLCICHPFARLLTLQRARLVVLVLATFAGVLGIIGALTHSVYRRVRHVTNATEHDSATQNRSAAELGHEAVYTGLCEPTDLILNTQFAVAFQRCYTSIFVMCLGIVVVLYSLIYRSVLQQRQKRQQMKAAPIVHIPQQPSLQHPRTVEMSAHDTSNQPPAMSCESDGTLHRDKGAACLDESPIEAVMMVSRSTDADADTVTARSSSKQTSMNATTAAAASETARRNRIANIKTAAMLFVVTVVFAVFFFPSLAMTVHILPYNMTIFYMYFANNVANPIIYSFMNTNFRKRLVGLFCK